MVALVASSQQMTRLLHPHPHSPPAAQASETAPTGALLLARGRARRVRAAETTRPRVLVRRPRVAERNIGRPGEGLAGTGGVLRFGDDPRGARRPRGQRVVGFSSRQRGALARGRVPRARCIKGDDRRLRYAPMLAYTTAESVWHL